MTTDVWDLYLQFADQDARTLSAAQRALVAICDLRQEVTADGFVGYFSARGGNSAEEALTALPAVLGVEWADLLRTATGLFGFPYPRDPDERFDRIDRHDLSGHLGELDAKYYELENSTEADARMNAYFDSKPV